LNGGNHLLIPERLNGGHYFSYLLSLSGGWEKLFIDLSSLGG